MEKELNEEKKLENATELKEAMDQAALVLMDRFLSELHNYEETDNRIEIATVKDIFFDSVKYMVGCFTPAKE